MNRIVIADTQFLVVEALTTLLGSDELWSLVGSANSTYELLKVLRNESCQLLITDPALLDYDGITELQKLMEEFQTLTVLILTNSLTKAEFTELNKIGIKNIIFKTAERDEILSAVEAALKGKKYYGDEILDMILESNDSKQVIEESAHLTISELEIVRLITGGMTTKEIAEKKCISFHTVNTHRKNIFRKLNVSNASELIIRAIKSGWIDNIEYFI